MFRSILLSALIACLATLVPAPPVIAGAGGTPYDFRVDGPNLDFNIVDNESLARFKQAVTFAEYTRFGYDLDARPRIIAATTGLVIFATKNPTATGAQLAEFVSQYNSALSASSPGDPDLLRTGNFVTAIEFTTPFADDYTISPNDWRTLGVFPSVTELGPLSGLDTGVAADSVRLLDMEVADVRLYMDLNTDRMSSFERARTRVTSESVPWFHAMVIGFSGQDLNGSPNERLAGALTNYLLTQGISPIPTGPLTEGRASIQAALAETLPVDYATFAAQRDTPLDDDGGSPLWAAPSPDSPGLLNTGQGSVCEGLSRTAWINELHYSNVGVDIGEFVEIAGHAGIEFDPPTGGPWRVVVYNGADGFVAFQIPLSGTMPGTGDDLGALAFSAQGLPDVSGALALVNEDDQVVDLIAYGTTFALQDGPAAGMTPFLLPEAESGTTASGQSLQRTNDPCAVSTLSPWWASVQGGLGELSVITNDRVVELASALSTEVSISQARTNAADLAFIEAQDEAIRAHLRAAARPRAIISANALLLQQGTSAPTQQLASQLETYSASSLETGKTMAAASSSAKILMGVGEAAFGFFGPKKDPAAIASGLAGAIGAAIGLGGVFADTGPTEDDQRQEILDEVVDLRNQLNDVQLQLNDRFDRVETQLAVIYTELSSAMQAVYDEINVLEVAIEDVRDEIQANADLIRGLETLIAEERSKLERIEDILWTVAADITQQDFENAVDNAFMTTSLTFNQYEMRQADFFSFAVNDADKAVFADSSAGQTLTLDNAGELLDSGAIGRSIQPLLRYAQGDITLPGGFIIDETPGPAAWSQGAAAYAQLARDKPWWLARAVQVGGDSGIQTVIDTGAMIDEATSAVRTSSVFDPIVTVFRDRIESLSERIRVTVPVDPFSGLEQSVHPSVAPWFQLEFFEADSGQMFPNLSNIPTAWNDQRFNLFGPNQRANIAAAMYPNQYSIEGSYHHLNGDGVYEITLETPISTHTRRFRLRLFRDGSQLEFCDDLFPAVCFGTFLGWEYFLNFNPNFGTFVLSEPRDLTGESTTYNRSGRTWEILVVEDSVIQTGLSALESELQSNGRRATARSQVLADGTLENLAEDLAGPHALIDGYATLGFPDLLELSGVAKATLRGEPGSGLSIIPTVDTAPGNTNPAGDTRQSIIDRYMTDPMTDTGTQGLIRDLEEIDAGLNELLSEIALAIAAPAGGHSYVDYMLADLTQIRDNALQLAVSDRFEFSYSGASDQLNVSASEGVLANDVRQPTLVDPMDNEYESVVRTDTMGGTPSSRIITTLRGNTVELFSDGSFTFTLDSVPVGDDVLDAFLYEAYRDAITSGTGGPVTSEPAIVVIRLTPSTGGGPINNRICTADLDNDGDVDLGDFGIFSAAFGSTAGDLSYNSDADFENDGDVDLGDFGAFGNEFGRSDCLDG